MNKYNASLLLSGEGDLVTVDADEAEVLYAFTASVWETFES